MPSLGVRVSLCTFESQKTVEPVHNVRSCITLVSMNEQDDKVQATFAKTQIEFSTDARDRLFRGVEIAAHAIGCTMGPHGKTVLIQRPDGTHVVTKDGVSVSKAIRLSDPVERMGADMVKEAASQTNDLAGDGTTTSTVLTHALVKEGLNKVNAKISPRKLILGMERGLDCVLSSIKTMAVKASDKDTLTKIATISANNDVDIGKLIAIALEKVGNDGIVTVEDAKGLETSLHVVEGMRFERGYLSPYFVTHGDKMHALHQDARVFVTDKKLKSVNDVVPLLEAIQTLNEPLIVIADDVEAEALQTLIVNRVKAKFPVVAIKAPGYGQTKIELLKDICTLTGALLVSESMGTAGVVSLPTAKFVESLGRVKKAIIDVRSTTLVGSGGTKEAVKTRVEELNSQLNDITLEPAAASSLKMRAARLSGGVAVVRVGGATEVEMIERKYRIEDALHAVKAAIDEGVVAGGGCALVRAVPRLKDLMSKETDLEIAAGMSAVMTACEAPMRTIVSNGGGQPDVILLKVRESEDTRLGYDAKTDKFVDMLDAGIIDPHKVTRLALTHAVSVAKTFINLDAVVFEEK